MGGFLVCLARSSPLEIPRGLLEAMEIAVGRFEDADGIASGQNAIRAMIV
jgi:hypothetical protein